MDVAHLKVVLYIDWVSQPSRALIAFCRLNNIPHELKEVQLRKAQHLKEPFISINPAKQVPAMQEVDTRTGQVVLTLAESHAILRYLAQSRGVADHWYPADLQKRALVNAYLDAHHTNLRLGMGAYIFKKLFAPVIINKTYTEKELVFEAMAREVALKDMERRLTDHAFLCGDEVSLADLSACCELDHGRFIALDLSGFPKTKAWLHRMIDEDPVLLEVHGPMRKVAALARQVMEQQAKL